jgi:hypothetical protein
MQKAEDGTIAAGRVWIETNVAFNSGSHQRLKALKRNAEKLFCFD